METSNVGIPLRRAGSNGFAIFEIPDFDWGIVGWEPGLGRPAIWLVLGAIGGFILGAAWLGCSALIFRSAMVLSPQSAPTRQHK